MPAENAVPYSAIKPQPWYCAVPLATAATAAFAGDVDDIATSIASAAATIATRRTNVG